MKSSTIELGANLDPLSTRTHVNRGIILIIMRYDPGNKMRRRYAMKTGADVFT